MANTCGGLNTVGVYRREFKYTAFYFFALKQAIFTIGLVFIVTFTPWDTGSKAQSKAISNKTILMKKTWSQWEQNDFSIGYCPRTPVGNVLPTRPFTEIKIHKVATQFCQTDPFYCHQRRLVSRMGTDPLWAKNHTAVKTTHLMSESDRKRRCEQWHTCSALF